jgi:uncharacterized protein (DUF302 family)
MHFSAPVSRRYLLKELTCSCLCWYLSPINKIISMDQKGFVIRPSPYSVKETIDRLSRFLEGHGATIYTRINQQSEVRHAGNDMPALEFILFGNPSAGGLIMAENPVAALDLPLKIIAWEDKDKKANLAYNEASYLQKRYGLSPALMQPLDLRPIVDRALTEGNQVF